MKMEVWLIFEIAAAIGAVGSQKGGHITSLYESKGKGSLFVWSSSFLSFT